MGERVQAQLRPDPVIGLLYDELDAGWKKVLAEKERIVDGRRRYPERTPAAKREELIAELKAHVGEDGYASRLAAREGVAEATVRGWMHHAKIPSKAMFLERDTRSLSFEEAYPVTAEDEAAPQSERCGFTKKRCKRARRCQYNLKEMKEMPCAGKVMGQMEVCSLAVQLETEKPCRSCNKRLCGELWRCWLLEHDGEGREALATFARMSRRMERLGI